MKYALVTGGSRGIGRAISVQLAKDGFMVTVNYKDNRRAAEETLRIIEESGGFAELMPFDVSDINSVDAAFDDWDRTHQDCHFDILVNNAGITSGNVMLDITPNQWHSVINTNLNSFYYVTRRVLTGMLISHHGRIVNMASIAGLRGFKGQADYAASKSAIIGATRSLASELAPKKITVNAVAPGYIDTEMTTGIDPLSIKQIIPMRRMGTAQEVADLVSFLSSEKASYITGQVISINGGML